MVDLITNFDEDLKRLLLEFVEDSEFYDHRLISGMSIVNPPEYLRVCRICNTPEGDHGANCILFVIDKVAMEGLR